MKKFEAPTLEEAYAAAAKEFTCSVTELDIQVVQNPSRGFLGFGRKNAIIVATAPTKKEHAPKHDTPKKMKKEHVSAPAKGKREKRKQAKATRDKQESVAVEEEQLSSDRELSADNSSVVEEAEKRSVKPLKGDDDKIFGNFYMETPDIASVTPEIEEHLNALFSHACFDIEPVKVSPYDDETILVEFQGNDAALLIGKEGYRYKALAHLLYNWIHGKYGFKVRLEIAEFLQNQETMIENYLKPIVERVENEGRGQTKVLDGILVQIALRRLRDRFPDKYVAVRTNREGGRYIIVNEFMEKK